MLLTDALVPAALQDQKAVAVIVAIAVGVIAADQPGIGADMGQLQATYILAMDAADKQAVSI